MATVNPDDLFAVNRDNITYYVEQQNLMASLKSTDYLALNRDNVTYKITGGEFIESITDPLALSPRVTPEVPPIGELLTVDPNASGGKLPYIYSYQWKYKTTELGAVVDFVGETGTTYLTTVSNEGYYIACEVTVTDSLGTTVTELSNFTEPVFEPTAVLKPSIIAPSDGAGEGVNAVSDEIVGYDLDTKILSLAGDKDLTLFQALDDVQQDSDYQALTSKILSVGVQEVTGTYACTEKWTQVGDVWPPASAGPFVAGFGYVYNYVQTDKTSMKWETTQTPAFPRVLSGRKLEIAWAGAPTNYDGTTFIAQNNIDNTTITANWDHPSGSTTSATKQTILSDTPFEFDTFELIWTGGGNGKRVGGFAGIYIDGERVVDGQEYTFNLVKLTLEDSTDLLNLRDGDRLQQTDNEASGTISDNGIDIPNSVIVIDGSPEGWLANNDNKLLGPVTTPATGTIGAIDPAANTMTLSVSDETYPKRWILMGGKFVKSKDKLSPDEPVDINGMITYIPNTDSILDVGTTDADWSYDNIVSQGWLGGITVSGGDSLVGGDGYRYIASSSGSEFSWSGASENSAIIGKTLQLTWTGNASTYSSTYFEGVNVLDGQTLRINWGDSDIKQGPFVFETFSIKSTGGQTYIGGISTFNNENGVISDGYDLGSDLAPLLILAGDKDLELLEIGDAIKQNDNAASGIVVAIGPGNTITLSDSIGIWSHSTGNYVVGPPTKIPGGLFKLYSSEFKSEPAGALAHTASDWQITLKTDTTYSNPVDEASSTSTDLTSWPPTNLEGEKAYRCRVKHWSGAIESEWSDDVTFMTAATSLLTGGVNLYDENLDAPTTSNEVKSYYGVDFDKNPSAAAAIGILPLTEAPDGYGVSHYEKGTTGYTAVPNVVSIAEQQMIDVVRSVGASLSAVRTALGLPATEEWPQAIDGYYPLYTSEAQSDTISTNNESHEHVLNGITYYMPSEGVTMYHGTYVDPLAAVESDDSTTDDSSDDSSSGGGY